MKNLRRALLFLPLVLLVLASAGGAATAGAAADIFARAPYLQMATSEGITVVWRTRAPITAAVRYGVAPGRLDKSVRDTAAIVTRVAPVPSGAATNLPRLHSAPAGT